MAKQFSDFGIEAPKVNFTGDKIHITDVLNKKIRVLDYLIEDSKFKGKRLRLQIEVNSAKRIMFSGSTALMAMIAKIPQGQAFETTIIAESKRLLFT